ncbi:hypothetical protein CCH79_00017435 [Gambusia affinis]|uniref:TBC1 domain family member 30 n=1 Tax=Gambusia affinis TaxID=33528 RepID=A0A315VH66_GAMAF|nr:hypothetical protein CCH79_00017435 [Gambusia affinis]
MTSGVPLKLCLGPSTKQASCWLTDTDETFRSLLSKVCSRRTDFIKGRIKEEPQLDEETSPSQLDLGLFRSRTRTKQNSEEIFLSSLPDVSSEAETGSVPEHRIRAAYQDGEAVLQSLHGELDLPSDHVSVEVHVQLQVEVEKEEKEQGSDILIRPQRPSTESRHADTAAQTPGRGRDFRLFLSGLQPHHQVQNQILVRIRILYENHVMFRIHPAGALCAGIENTCCTCLWSSRKFVRRSGVSLDRSIVSSERGDPESPAQNSEAGSGSGGTGPPAAGSRGVFHGLRQTSTPLINPLRIGTGPAAGNMAARLEPSREELLEVNICDRSVGSEEESGVFSHSTEDFCGFQQWTHNDTSSSSSSSPSSRPEELRDPEPAAPRSSIVDRLLVELYDAFSGGGGRRTADSWDSSTGSGSDTLPARSNSGCGFLQELQERHTRRLQMIYLGQKDLQELRSIIQEVKHRSGLQSTKLLRQLKRRDRLVHKRQKNYDVITACLQAVSQKRRRSGSPPAGGPGRPAGSGRRARRGLAASLAASCGNATGSPAAPRGCSAPWNQVWTCGVDTRLKFTIEPSLGNNGFQQWYDALKAVARLPTGIPREWRKKVWLTLADRYLHSISIDWDKTLRFTFNERSNPDDDSLGIQIVKDLHRTGCSSYCGQEGEQDRVVLKRVLLAYARWNKSVGYCQGFNVLAALILEVTEGNESDALKVMIYLIDKVLPESYFANNLRALSVDMAVFRDLLRLKLPRLSQHLHHLQKAANREAGGKPSSSSSWGRHGSYEPPLTNVFTMQWFLTMFATCLPAPTVLKIWDSVFFEGSEVLFRAALAIWERLGERIEDCQSADEFYSTMGGLTQEMLEQNLLHPAQLMQDVYSMAPFPFPQLAELREKYTYNITPFPTAAKVNTKVNTRYRLHGDHVGQPFLPGVLLVFLHPDPVLSSSSGPSGWDSEEDVDVDDDDSLAAALGCLGPLGGLLAPELQRYQKHLKDQRVEQGSIAELSPGAVGGAAAGSGRAEHQAAVNSMMLERMSTDITALKKQYGRIKRRQQQQAMRLCIRTGEAAPPTRTPQQEVQSLTALCDL